MYRALLRTEASHVTVELRAVDKSTAGTQADVHCVLSCECFTRVLVGTAASEIAQLSRRHFSREETKRSDRSSHGSERGVLGMHTPHWMDGHNDSMGLCSYIREHVRTGYSQKPFISTSSDLGLRS